MGPGTGHWLGGVGCVGRSKDLLDSTKFRQSVDLVCLERTNQLSFLVLKSRFSSDKQLVQAVRMRVQMQ